MNENNTQNKPDRKKRKPMSRGFLAAIIIIIVVAAGVLGYSLYRLIGIDQSYKEANSLYEELDAEMAAEAGQVADKDAEVTESEEKASEESPETKAAEAPTTEEAAETVTAEIREPSEAAARTAEAPTTAEPAETKAAAEEPSAEEEPSSEDETEPFSLTETFSDEATHVWGTNYGGTRSEWLPVYELAEFSQDRPTAFSGFGRASRPWNYQALHDKYPDAVGWIYQEGTMSYPVVQAEDNNKYLRNMINGSYNVAGTLFVDYVFKDGLKGRYSIIYGHNMDDGSMFGTLTKYKDESYYKEHPTFELYVGDKMYRYHVYAAFKAAVDSPLFIGDGMDEKQFQEMVDYIEEEKLYETSAPKITDKSVLTVLSTCIEYPRNYDFRYIVVLIRECPLLKYQEETAVKS